MRGRHVPADRAIKSGRVSARRGHRGSTVSLPKKLPLILLRLLRLLRLSSGIGLREAVDSLERLLLVGGHVPIAAAKGVTASKRSAAAKERSLWLVRILCGDGGPEVAEHYRLSFIGLRYPVLSR